ncbi:MAG: coiled-coil domain-containing protein, partial [Coriobacteriales bacterium]
DEQEEASSDALRSLYKYQRSAPSLINLVFSSEDVSSLFGTLDYLNRCEQNNLDIIQEQIDNKNELEATTKQLKADKEEASQAKTDAANALADAKAARQKAMEAATEKAAAELEAQNNQGNSQSSSVLTASVSENSQDTSQMKSSVDTDDVDWSQEKSDFVDEWTSRINNYLAGSPLAGYGETFAEAAWDYGVDPRWSPAIACVESGKGASCFRSHNAWGWGTSSWSSWEEAITAHVSGLARIYGSTLTPSAAQKYCPSNATYWYNKCLSEMNKI